MKTVNKSGGSHRIKIINYLNYNHMKKFLLFLTMVATVFTTFVSYKVYEKTNLKLDAPVEALTQNEGTYYQTMGYCPDNHWKIVYKCTLVETSEVCRLFHCKTAY